MTEICRFYGIVIKIHFADHAPPHFHAEYAEHEARIARGERGAELHVGERSLRLSCEQERLGTLGQRVDVRGPLGT